MRDPKSFREVIGDAVRRLREGGGMRQEDLARTAQVMGLKWSRSKVAALELGDKAVTLEEFAVLPVLLEETLNRKITYGDLFPDHDELLYLTPKLRVLAGRWASIFDDEYVPELTVYDRAVEDSLEKLAATQQQLEPIFKRLKALGYSTGLPAISSLREATVGLAEDRAAAKLGEPRLVVVAVSLDLWGRSLTEERDARVAAALPDDAPARSVQARRGLVTRELVDALQGRIAELDGR
ncbi:hypothetical protein [Actinomadura sp. NTSP31]|uniref:hypothetical protein n=1 Tax=Actinomadura sp. NTSP31 TaxID=1735447 RepID=UPI0035C1B335